MFGLSRDPRLSTVCGAGPASSAFIVGFQNHTSATAQCNLALVQRYDSRFIGSTPTIGAAMWIVRKSIAEPLDKYPKQFRLCRVKQLQIAEVMSWLGKRSYATRVAAFRH